MDLLIGKITHYYDKIGVAVIEVTGHSIAVGNTVKISGHDQEFEQNVKSLQIEHKNIDKVVKGKEAGLKVDKPVKVGDSLFAVPEK